jgi:transposase InsO family protein
VCKDNFSLARVHRFSRWVISIPCTKTLTTAQLSDVLFQEVFSWVGLPESISGDRDSRLTAKQMRSLCPFLGVKLKHSTAHHPQYDGTFETFSQLLRAVVSDNHKNWSEHILALLFKYMSGFFGD